MKATELIAKLQALVAEHGDRIVVIDGSEGGAYFAEAPRLENLVDRGDDVPHWCGRFDWRGEGETLASTEPMFLLGLTNDEPSDESLDDALVRCSIECGEDLR